MTKRQRNEFDCFADLDRHQLSQQDQPNVNTAFAFDYDLEFKHQQQSHQNNHQQQQQQQQQPNNSHHQKQLQQPYSQEYQHQHQHQHPHQQYHHQQQYQQQQEDPYFFAATANSYNRQPPPLTPHGQGQSQPFVDKSAHHNHHHRNNLNRKNKNSSTSDRSRDRDYPEQKGRERFQRSSPNSSSSANKDPSPHPKRMRMDGPRGHAKDDNNYNTSSNQNIERNENTNIQNNDAFDYMNAGTNLGQQGHGYINRFQSQHPENFAQQGQTQGLGQQMGHESNQDVPKFIKVAQKLGQCVVESKNIDRALRHLHSLRQALAEEKDLASDIMSGKSRQTLDTLSDTMDVHWINNFLFLQIGYVSSFKQNQNSKDVVSENSAVSSASASLSKNPSKGNAVEIQDVAISDLITSRTAGEAAGNTQGMNALNLHTVPKESNSKSSRGSGESANLISRGSSESESDNDGTDATSTARSQCRGRGSNLSQGGPWSEFASKLMQETVQTLVVLHEYNYVRCCLANKPASMHRLPTRGTFAPLQQMSVQLTEAEIRECANILCKVMRRTLDKMGYLWSMGSLKSSKSTNSEGEMKQEDRETEYISSLKAGVSILDLLQKSMYSTRSVLRNDEKTMDVLVRIVADLASNAKVANDNSDVLARSTSLMKTLSARTDFDTEFPLSEYATICTDIIMSCSLNMTASAANDWHVLPYTSESNQAFFFSFLQKLRFALRSKNDSSIQEKWHMLFRTMEIMLKTASSGDKMVKTILTVITYLSMSRRIVRFLVNNKALVSAIAFVVTRNDPNRNRLNRGGKDIQAAAMQCVTLLATKLVRFCPDYQAGCLNVIEIILSMATDTASIQIQGDIIKGLRLFVGRNLEELDEAIRRLSEKERKDILWWLARSTANKQAGRSMKQAAITLVLELYFCQSRGKEDKPYGQIKDATRTLIQCKDLGSEEFIIRTLSGKLRKHMKLVTLFDSASFLTGMVSIAGSDKHVTQVRDESMKLLKEVASSNCIGRKLSNMSDFTECMIKFLSFEGVGEDCIIYRHYALETLIQIGQSNKGKLTDRRLISAIQSFVRKLPTDYDKSIASKIQQHPTQASIESSVILPMKSKLLKLVEILATSR